jgi:hypothetical protein
MKYAVALTRAHLMVRTAVCDVGGSVVVLQWYCRGDAEVVLGFSAADAADYKLSPHWLQ